MTNRLTPYWDPNTVITEEWWNTAHDVTHMMWVVRSLPDHESKYLIFSLIALANAIGEHDAASFARVGRFDHPESAWLARQIASAAPHASIVRRHLPWSRIATLLQRI